MDSPASETVDVHATGSATQSSQYTTPQVDETADVAEQTSPTNDDGTDQPQKLTTGHMQKRRRVTRACDECRRKKIKCDGKQPCTHCTVYSYDCTYDQPSNRRRNAAPQYIESLETQLKRAKALLSIVFPSLDLNDPSIDVHLQSGVLPPMPMRAPRPQQTMHDPRMSIRPDGHAREESTDSHLESMVKATGQLDLDEEGNWDYHGHSSGLTFMRRLEQQFGAIAPPQQSGSPFIKYRPLSQVFDSPSSTHHSPVDSSSVLQLNTDLPTKQEARMLCDCALIEAGALMRIVHLPSFYKSVDRVYEISPENYGHAENTFLPLLYAVLALGTLFSKNDAALDKIGYEACIEDGFKYFRASRQLLDIADCRDLTSLQAIVTMIQFLQSSAKLSTCYAYIGVAMRSALRMGMHRSFNTNFNPIEAETRKRVFWTIRRMDIYVGALLGLPIFLKDEDVDQEWPMEVDDEYITETEIRPMPEGKVSVFAAFNAHTRLVSTLEKICKYVYPIKGTQSGGKNSVSYSVSYSKIRELEQELQRWLDELPMALRPGGEAPHIIIRVQQLLRIAFGHAQLLLYRPFLHYVSQSYKNTTIDQRAFACASACISVSRNIIHITAEMKRRGLLLGAYWFSMYTTFFAILSLLYFVLENPNSPTSRELFREALEGRDVLAHFAKRSMAADRCTATLNTIFERIPEKTKQVLQSGEPTGSKKRRQGSSPQPLQSTPNLLRQEDFPVGGLRRAQTFPESLPCEKGTAGHPLPISHTHLANLGIGQVYGRSPSQSSSEFFDSVPSLTPSSTTPSIGGYGIPRSDTSQQRPGPYPVIPLTSNPADPSGLNVPLSDVNAMMFPSTDPFAYPNQPMTTFENNHPQAFKTESSPTIANLPFQVPNIDMKQHPVAYSPGGMNVPIGPRRPNDNDVQLFGPMPMYLMHGAQQQGPGRYPQRPGPQGLQMVGTPEGGNMSFDDLLGGDEWANTFLDPGLGLSGAGSGFGGNPAYGTSGGPGMPNWR